MDFPKVVKVRQTFPRPRVESVEGTVREQLRREDVASAVRPGMSVAVTAGSRGIARIDEVLRAVVDGLKEMGAQPFIVPAMGSHGGGTAEGQVEVLAGYGITAAYCGCPIRASMETVVVCHSSEGIPVHFDQQARAADHVLVVGRVKPHTEMLGDIQSGLMKMMLIGLGKHRGAAEYHQAMTRQRFDELVSHVAPMILQQMPIALGLAIVE
ncbi:MAG: DUF2088 domain-containing protein, partial [Rubrobacteraceae bacterium]|nr:DUF2088 domain-containing protein [Rubrobacteraceae bacterium]